MIFFESDNIIIVSNFDIVSLINNFSKNHLDPPTESILLLMPEVDDEFTKKMSRVFGTILKS